MTYALRDLDGLNRLSERRVPEGPGLEYKAVLALGSRRERLEMLKDLTGMGNGGGGAIVYGMSESKDDDLPVAAQLTPLSDSGLPGVLEDVVRAGVRPPLLMTVTSVEVGGRLVLVVDVARSPLGPYMVEAYGEQRYHMRIGSRTVPMTEQQVRDAYFLAARARENRQETWRTHNLPIDPQVSEPWLTASGIPEEPLHDLFDPGDVNLETFVAPARWKALLDLGRLNSIADQMARWADRVFAHNGYDDRTPSSIIRIHRDGAAGVAIRLRSRLGPIWVPRAVNSLVGYLGWIWDHLAVRAPIEFQVRLDQVQGTTLELEGTFERERDLSQPPGTTVSRISLSREVLPNELVRASVRHSIVADFADRMAHAFGLARAGPMFRDGQLYGRTGDPLGLAMPRNGIWGDDRGQLPLAYVYEDGSIRNATTQALIGFLDRRSHNR